MALQSNKLGPPLARLAVVGQDTGTSDYSEKANGTRYVFTTTSSRNSATIVDTVGHTYGWISKDALHRATNGEKALVLLAAGKLVGVKSGPDTIDLYSAAEQPAPTIVTGRLHLGDGSMLLGNGGSLTARIDNPTINSKEENTMNNFIANLISTNKKAAGDAAVLEAGRIANNTLVKLIVSRMPFLARFTGAKYFQGPIGKLVVANGALVLAQQLRPNDPRVRSLTEAMATQAYQETYQIVDVEGVIDQLLNLPEIQRAMRKLDESKPADTGLGRHSPLDN
jgi:hypothetical protein